MKQRTLTFGLKLGIATGILSLVIVLLAFVGLRQLGTMQAMLHHTVDVNARKVELAGVVNAAESDKAVGQRGAVMFTFATDPGLGATGDSLFRESNVKFQPAMTELRPLLVTDTAKQLIAEMDN